MKSHYPVDKALDRAQQGLAFLQAVLDPSSIRHLEALGVGEGWQRAEVCGEAGSITEWLCRRVGPTGCVLATDMDTRFLDEMEYPNLEVRRHDVTTQQLPEAAFDLAHARALDPPA